MYDVVVAPQVSDAVDSGTPRDGRVEVTLVGASRLPVAAGEDAHLGPPIAGARVRALAIIDDRAYLAGAAESDSTGGARFDLLPRGVVWILADAPGLARASSHLVVGEEPRAVTLELGPEHVVDVTVKDEVGAPLALAEIEISASDDPLPVGARADGEGHARVGRLGKGPWRAIAHAPGYEDGVGRSEQGTDAITMVLRKLGALSVHVVEDADKPASGARVMVGGATLWPARAAQADAGGDVRIAGLAAGSYALRAIRGDLVSPIELGVSLGRGEDKAVVLRLGPGRWVRVRVTGGEAEDAPSIAAARVTLAEGGLSPFPFEGTTDLAGRVRLGPIAPGGATLAARADGFVPRAIALAQAPSAETRVALVRAGVVTGAVADDRGFPIDGATVELVGTDPSGAPIYDDPSRLSFQTAHFDAMLAGPAPLVAAGELGVLPGPVAPIPQRGFSPFGPPTSLSLAEPWVTRADGTFRASPASPGRIRAVVHHPQYVEAESDVVTLGPGGEAHVDVVMRRGGALEGQVVDVHDRPVARARIIVSSARSSLERTTRTASDGTFAFAALPDTVSVTASVEDDEDQPDARVTLAIPELGRRDVTIRLPEARGGLPVTVVDDHDWPVETAQISASSLSADVPLRVTAFADARGDAMLKRARGLPLRIEASAPGHAPRVLVIAGSEEAVRIELASAETANGEVIAATGGGPVAGAEVSLYTNLGVRRALTDARGAFALRELSPGPASLRVDAQGFATLSQSVTVPDTGGVRPFELAPIELGAEGVVEGEVVDARGDPVVGARVARDHAPTWLAAGAGSEAGATTTDAGGRFALHGLAEGTIVLEAYAPDFGRARTEGVQVVSGRTTSRVRISMTRGQDDEPRATASTSSGNVAVTLGETGEPVEVVIVSVAVASEAERAGLAPGDILLAVDGEAVQTIEQARDRLAGPLSDDVVVRVRRAEGETAVRVPRESVRR